jgi:hypothetical protein
MSVCPSVSFLLSASLFVHTTPLFRFRVHFLPIPDIINLACPCFQKPIITAYLGARLSPQEACVLLSCQVLVVGEPEPLAMVVVRGP